MKKSSAPVSLFIRISISLLILAVLCYYKEIDIYILKEEWGKANGALLIITAIASLVVHTLAGADKLWRVLRAMNVDISFKEIFRIRMGTGPLRVLMPLKTGDLINIAYLRRCNYMPFGQASGAVIFDKGLNGIGIFFWLLLSIVFLPDILMHWQLPAAFAICLFYFSIVFNPWLQEKIAMTGGLVHPKIEKLVKEIMVPFKSFPNRLKLFFITYGILFQARPLIVIYLLFMAYGITPDISNVIAYTSIAILFGHIPITPLGIGPREATLVALFAGQATSEIIVSVAALMTLAVYVIPMMAGAFWTPGIMRDFISPDVEIKM